MAEQQKKFIIQELKNRGFRITKQRRVLLDVILANECSSCKEIFFEATKRDDSIGTATVYRMVNLLEDIGAIDRKNMYKVSYPGECNLEEACIAEFEDDTICRLSAKEWNEVLAAGLRTCGYSDGQRLRRVTIHPCACGCEGGQRDRLEALA